MDDGQTLVVYRFSMGDVEDPEIYAGSALHSWTESEVGKWCKSHAINNDLVYNISNNVQIYGYTCTVTGKFLPKDRTYFYLKYKDLVDFN
jgi:hypothetical protein